jgi:type II secretory pathway component GspD/PulD (secretin)
VKTDWTRWPALVATGTLLASAWPVLAQQPQESQQTRAQADSDWTVKVIRLDYADAFEVAGILAQIVPPTVRVVAYRPTNSIIISGDSAVLGSIAEDAE